MKTLLLLTLVALSSLSFAQTVNFGIKAGLNVSSLSSANNGTIVVSANNAGFHAGVFADVGFGGFTVQPAVLYTTKGGEEDYTSTYTSITPTGTTTGNYSYADKITLNYIAVPVNLLYHIRVPIGKVFFGGGPYLAYGISGTEKATSSITGAANTVTSNNVTYGNSASDFKNPDFGFNILGGLMLNHGLSLSIGYSFGLANLENLPSGNNGTLKSNVFDVSLGYSFL